MTRKPVRLTMPHATGDATGKSNRPWHKKPRQNNGLVDVPRVPRAFAPIPHARAITRARARIKKTPLPKEIRKLPVAPVAHGVSH